MKLTTLVNRVALVAALLGSSVALADKLDAADLATVAHLHALDQMEIQMGKLAEKNSSTAGVKAFGETLVKDHTQNDKDLTALAKKRGAAIPKDVPADAAEKQQAKDDMDAMTKLKTLKGAEFDRMFLTAMVDGHERELAKLIAAIGSTKDDDLLALEKATQPVMESHASTARDLQKNAPQAAK